MAAVPQPAIANRDNMAVLIDEIDAAIRAEIPGIKHVEITYNPGDERVPLMILAFKA